MSPSAPIPLRPIVGLIGFGAFGRLIATHLAPHCAMRVYDPARPAQADGPALPNVAQTGLAEAAQCSVVILATPVSAMADVVVAIGPHLRPGTLVVDVGSVKSVPAAIMRQGLPEHAEILATHPLFGPQSARQGIRGLKIAVCPIRGRRARLAVAFLRCVLALEVIVTTPEEHDREAAVAQGLTHLIARTLIAMEPLPARMTTRSFDLIMQAVDMVRHDAPEVVEAIERINPYAADVRRQFTTRLSELATELGPRARAPTTPPAHPVEAIGRGGIGRVGNGQA